MNIRALKSLVAVADHGSFAAAAAAVHLSQSALSVQIKQLEERLGRRLFNREYRPPTLNDYGRAVVSHARSILLLHREIYQLTSRSETPHETLRVGLIPSWALGVMPTTLATLRQVRSLVTIEVVYAPAPDLHAKLGCGEIDVAIVPMPSRQQTHLRWHRLVHEPFMLITSTWHGGEPWQEVIRRSQYIRYVDEGGVTNELEVQLASEGIEVNPIMVSNALLSVQAVVQAGLGVSIVPRWTGVNTMSSQLKWLPVDDARFARAIGAMVSASKRGDRTVQVFIDTLDAVIKKTNARPLC